MGAYAAAATIPDRVAKKITGTGLGILRGTINVTNYNATRAEITGITGKFRSAPTVILGGLSSNGYLVAWDTTDKAVKAWYPIPAHGHDFLIIGGQGDQIGGAPNIVSCVNATAVLGKEEATNTTIATADVATKGGVKPSTAAAGGEVATDVNVGVVSFVAIGPAP